MTSDIVQNFADHKVSFKDECASTLKLKLCFLLSLHAPCSIMHFLSGLPGFGNSTLLHYFDVLWIITSHGSLCSWNTAQKHSERMWKLSFERESHVSTSNKRSNFSGRRTCSFVCMPYRSDHKRFFQGHNLSECPQPFIKTTLTGTSTQELSIQPQTLVNQLPMATVLQYLLSSHFAFKNFLLLPMLIYP